MRLRISLSILVLLAACGGDGATPGRAGSGVTVRDSAGVRIVENHDSAWTDDTRWRLADEPDYRIGSVDGSVPGTDWGNLLQARAMGNDVVVYDLMSPGFRVFDDEGVWVETLGRSGEGPLELQGAGEWALLGDSLVVSDGLGTKVVVFDRGAGEATSYRVEDPPVETDPWSIGRIEIGWVVYDWFDDGSYISRNTPDPRGLEPGFTTLDAEYHRMAPNGDYLGPLGVHPVARVYTLPDGEQGVIPFMTMPHISTSRMKLWHAFADSLFEVRRIDAESGAVDQLVRIDGRGQRVTEEMLARLREVEDEQIIEVMEQMGGGADPAMLAEMRGAMEELRARQPEPGWAPTVFGLRALASGHLLVDLPEWEWHMQPNQLLMGNVPDDEAVSFAVFDPDGRWLGTLEAPTGLIVSDVTDDYVIGYRKDEFDVPYIERWRLIRP